MTRARQHAAVFRVRPSLPSIACTLVLALSASARLGAQDTTKTTPPVPAPAQDSVKRAPAAPADSAKAPAAPAAPVATDSAKAPAPAAAAPADSSKAAAPRASTEPTVSPAGAAVSAPATAPASLPAAPAAAGAATPGTGPITPAATAPAATAPAATAPAATAPAATAPATSAPAATTPATPAAAAPAATAPAAGTLGVPIPVIAAPPPVDSAPDANQFVQRASVLLEMGKTEQAVSELKAGLKTDALDSDTYNALADVYKQTGKSKLALDTYAKGLSVIDHAPELRVPYAELLYRSKKKDSAIAVLKKGIELDPDPDMSREMKALLGKIIVDDLGGEPEEEVAAEEAPASSNGKAVASAPSAKKKTVTPRISAKKRVKKPCKLLICPEDMKVGPRSN